MRVVALRALKWAGNATYAIAAIGLWFLALAVLGSVAGCGSNSQPEMVGRASKGHTMAQMEADGAACRNEARAIVGVNRSASFWPTYTDCMIGKGYEVKR